MRIPKLVLLALLAIAGLAIMACSTAEMAGLLGVKSLPTPTTARTSSPTNTMEVPTALPSANPPTAMPTAKPSTAVPTARPRPTATAVPPTPVPTQPSPQGWQGDDPPRDLYVCKTDKPVAQDYMDRVNKRIYLDIKHVSMQIVPLKDAYATVGGQMCGYKITVTYDHPIGQKRFVQGEAEFTSGNLRASYHFVMHDNKVTWKPDVRNLDSGATVVPGNMADFHVSVEDGRLVVVVPCYAVPYLGSDSVWDFIAYNTRPDGSKLYCDSLNPQPKLPKPSIVWDGSTPLTIGDPPDDVMNITSKVDNIHYPLADITALTVELGQASARLS